MNKREEQESSPPEVIKILFLFRSSISENSSYRTLIIFLKGSTIFLFTIKYIMNLVHQVQLEVKVSSFSFATATWAKPRTSTYNARVNPTTIFKVFLIAIAL